MRWFLALVFVGLGALWYVSGLRLGYLTLTPLLAENARGESNYTFRTYDARQVLILQGNCQTRRGLVVLRLYDPSGREVANGTCPRGTYSLNLRGSGQGGLYKLNVRYEQFSGRIDLEEARGGE